MKHDFILISGSILLPFSTQCANLRSEMLWTTFILLLTNARTFPTFPFTLYTLREATTRLAPFTFPSLLITYYSLLITFSSPAPQRLNRFQNAITNLIDGRHDAAFWIAQQRLFDIS